MTKTAIRLIILFLSTAIGLPEQMIDCSYTAKKTKADLYPEFQKYKNCGIIKGGKISLYPQHLQQMHFDRYGIAAILVADHFYYVKPNGSMLAVIAFDNGADDFREGLVRSQANRRIAYFNREFKQVIAPKYDWGWPFENGRALVCLGCKAMPPDVDGHRSVTGGAWGYIDKKGKEIVPVKFSEIEIRRFSQR